MRAFSSWHRLLKVTVLASISLLAGGVITFSVATLTAHASLGQAYAVAVHPKSIDPISAFAIGLDKDDGVGDPDWLFRRGTQLFDDQPIGNGDGAGRVFSGWPFIVLEGDLRYEKQSHQPLPNPAWYDMPLVYQRVTHVDGATVVEFDPSKGLFVFDCQDMLALRPIAKTFVPASILVGAVFFTAMCVPGVALSIRRTKRRAAGRCASCGFPLPTGAAICPECGHTEE